MSAHPADSAIFGHMWSTPESHDLFDDEPRIRSWLEILTALAQAQADVGLIPPAAAAAIQERSDISRIDLDFVAAETRSTGHSTLGLIRALRAVLPEQAREWVYYGATVQDLSDTWGSLVCRRVGDIFVRDVTEMRDAAVSLAVRYRDTPMCGRTHGQPGLPITFGFKAAVWADELNRHLVRLAQGRSRWEVVQLGGALGTMEFWGDRAPDLLDTFASRVGLNVPEICWLTARDRIAEFVGLLASAAATVAKIGNEIYQLQRPEIGEVREGFRSGTVGSITMPHKRNPEHSEQLVSLSRIVRAQAGLALEGMVSEHERDGRAWKTEWVVLPEACLAFTAAVGMGAGMLRTVEVDTARMVANIDSHDGYLQSEPVMRALADRVGKHTAHEVVYQACMGGIASGQSFRAALRADPRLDDIGDEELDRLLDVRSSLGSTGVFVDRVVRSCGGRQR
jgi:adenylosuccinate lyase